MIQVLLFNFLNRKGGQLSLREQPALRSGITTFFEGFTFCRLCHKVYAGKNDHIGICFFRILRQPQTITDIICYILNIRLLVVMRQDNSILFFF